MLNAAAGLQRYLDAFTLNHHPEPSYPVRPGMVWQDIRHMDDRWYLPITMRRSSGSLGSHSARKGDR